MRQVAAKRVVARYVGSSFLNSWSWRLWAAPIFYFIFRTVLRYSLSVFFSPSLSYFLWHSFSCILYRKFSFHLLARIFVSHVPINSSLRGIISSSLILSYLILSYLILSYLILSYLVILSYLPSVISYPFTFTFKLISFLLPCQPSSGFLLFSRIKTDMLGNSFF